MPVNIIPDDEMVRMDALNRFEILNTLPEKDFDAITVLAAEIFDTERAHICFVDKEQVFIKASVPTDYEPRAVARVQSLCSLSILKEGVTVYGDTLQCYELMDSPFLSTEEDIRFYAAAPIRNKEGSALGTICVTDSKPHMDVTEKQTKLLQLLADTVMEKLETRLAGRQQLKSHEESLRRLSHDLKNPVTSISLYAQLLGSREMSAEKVFSMASKIEISSKKIENLLSSIVANNTTNGSAKPIRSKPEYHS
ncbi:MAG: GAF domain-containing protein [Pedobacter sp.]|uniref:sensor histidine kinase n=1 Tax=Pedobacter sp. TaxID=1411316 RepID=UPI0033932FC4